MQVSGIARLVSTSEGKARLEVAGRPMFELNSVAAMIWETLAAGVPTEEIIGHLVTRYNVPEDRAAGDVTKFIELLKEYLLIVDDAPSEAAITK